MRGNPGTALAFAAAISGDCAPRPTRDREMVRLIGEAVGQEVDQRGLVADVERAGLEVAGALGVGEVA